MTHHDLLPSLLCIAALSTSGAMYMWTSRINQFFFFGRTLPAEFVSSPAAQEITKRYVRQMRNGFLLSLCIFIVFRVSGLHLSWAASLLIALLYQYVFFHARFARAHRDAGEAFYKSGLAAVRGGEDLESNAVVSVSLLDREKETRISVPHILLPGVIALCVWIGVATLGHVGFANLGNAVDAVGGSNLLGLGMGMLCAATGLMLLMRFSARQRSQLARRNRRLSLSLAWIATAIFTGTMLAVPLHLHITRTFAHGILFVVLGFAIGQVLYTVIRRDRFVPPAAEQRGDSCWRWGMYYYNPSDPALFVQSRCGSGYTLNFANIFSWPVALVIYGNFGFLLFLSMHR
jgi:hypothetical protein